MPDVPPKQPVTGTDSVRMNTGAGLPPFPSSNTDSDPVPVTPASPSAGMSASAALVSMHNAASQAGGDAFPVLKAFQDYLESERQRARRRMTMLSIVFSIAIIAVVGAFGLIWFSTMHGMQETNRQLLDAALRKTTAEPPAPIVVQPDSQPSAAEPAKVVAEVISRAQSDQSAAFAKTLEDLNASLAAMRQDNEAMKAEIEQAKAAAAKAEADRLAAEEAAAKAAMQKSTVGNAASQRTATPGYPGLSGLDNAAFAESVSAPAAKAEAPPQPTELQIPKYDAPPPPTGFSQDIMAVRLPKEPRPISWRVYVPVRAE